MNTEEHIEEYLLRKEFLLISSHHLDLFRRYVRMKRKRTEYPVGRCLAYALLRFNCRYNIANQPFSDKFINWLYTY